MTPRSAVLAAAALVVCAATACGDATPDQPSAAVNATSSKLSVSAPDRGVRVAPAVVAGSAPVTVSFKTPIALDEREDYGVTYRLRGPITSSCKTGDTYFRDTQARRVNEDVAHRIGFAGSDFRPSPRTSWCRGSYKLTAFVRHARDRQRVVGTDAFKVKG